MTDRPALLREVSALETELARRRMLPFVQRLMPAYEANWHHAVLAAELDAVVAGETKRLMVFMPPQNGKTELVSRKFPAFVLGKRPDWNVIAGSYNSDLAEDVSREVQKAMALPAYRELFPGTRLAGAKDLEIRRQGQFDVVGREGGYYSAGVGKGISGRPMQLGIVDDPYPGRNEAESAAYRKMVWNWYIGDFARRMSNDQVPIVIVQTRWHEDDLCGRLLEIARSGPHLPQWRVVQFPAVCEQEGLLGDPRRLGEALWPSRFSRAFLDVVKAEIGVYDWSALYQQEPVPAGGAMAQRSWFKVGPPRGGVVQRCRCWDLAATKQTPGRDPDWTVGTLLNKHADRSWSVEHVVRVRTTPGEVDKLMLSTARMDGSRTLIREWLDPGAAGKSVTASHRTMLAGYDYEELPSSGEKSTRWRPFLVQAEGGNVWIVDAPWNRDWLDELSLVPYGKHDDQADSVAGAFIALTEHKDKGATAAAVMPAPSQQPGAGAQDWRQQYFRR